eukprot:252014-Pyramimonas_sp.AAC.1
MGDLAAIGGKSHRRPRRRTPSNHPEHAQWIGPAGQGAPDRASGARSHGDPQEAKPWKAIGFADGMGRKENAVMLAIG